MIRSISTNIRKQLKTIIVLMVLLMMGLVDLMLIVNPNEMMFSKIEFPSEVPECDMDCGLDKKFEAEFFIPSDKEIIISKEKFLQKDQGIMPFDTLYLGDTPVILDEDLLYFL